MRLPATAHTSRPWRIHEFAGGFRVEDVWALPTPGGADDFPRLVRLIASGAMVGGSSRATHALFAIRRQLGTLFGWDDRDADHGPPPSTLRDRLPPDLRDAAATPAVRMRPFAPLYLTGDEWAMELINRTAHAILHIGWVRGQTGGYRGQLAVLVKPNGLFGTSYMAAIAPFRYLIVYPSMLHAIGQRWRSPA